MTEGRGAGKQVRREATGTHPSPAPRRACPHNDSFASALRCHPAPAPGTGHAGHQQSRSSVSLWLPPHFTFIQSRWLDRPSHARCDSRAQGHSPPIFWDKLLRGTPGTHCTFLSALAELRPRAHLSGPFWRFSPRVRMTALIPGLLLRPQGPLPLTALGPKATAPKQIILPRPWELGKVIYPDFTNEEAKAQRRELTYLMSHS